MPIRKPKPTSAGRRFVTYPDYAEITRTKPEKSLVEGLKKSGGRNSNGRKTARHRGGDYAFALAVVAGASAVAIAVLTSVGPEAHAAQLGAD